jgi:hypothetical protein
MSKQTNPNSLKNLRPAKKGEVRNPNGRPPKVKSIPDILQKVGKEKIESHRLLSHIANYFPGIAKDLTFQEAVLRLVYAYAIEGAPWAVQYIAERTEGKVPQTLTVIDDIEEREKFRELSIETLEKLAYADESKN